MLQLLAVKEVERKLDKSVFASSPTVLPNKQIQTLKSGMKKKINGVRKV